MRMFFSFNFCTLSSLIPVFTLILMGVSTAETLVTSLSSHRVAITSNYTGDSIVVFGAIEKDAQTIPRAGGYDLVVTIYGPPQPLAVREKIKIGPFWINRESQKFPNAPAYLMVLSSRPLDEIAPENVRNKQKIGIQAITHTPEFTNARDGKDIPFRDALKRLKEKDALFVELNRGVTFLTPTIFRAAAPLPAISPPGDYHIDIALLAEGVVLTRQYSSFELVKTGFEQNVGIMAHKRPLTYGFIVAAIAIFCGFFANFVFRRN